ncbi:MAG: hypothetical protein AAGI07_19505, partial [Bacteroidota bacterium]
MIFRLKLLIILALCLNPSLESFSQDNSIFTDVEIRIGSAIFTLKNDLVLIREEPHLSFYFEDESETAEVYFKTKSILDSTLLRLEATNDYEVLDSLTKEADNLYRVKILFKRLSESNFLRFSLLIGEGTDNREVIRLFPYTEMKASLDIQAKELFIGEEKTYEIFTNHPENIKLQPAWEKEGN